MSDLMEFVTRLDKVEHPILVRIDDIVALQPSLAFNRAGQPNGFDGTLIKLRHETEPVWVVTAYEDVRDSIVAAGMGVSLEGYRQWLDRGQT